MPIIIFDPSLSYITPEVIEPITYVLRDPELKIVLPLFQSNRPYLSAIYELMK
jgi:hypothetical protein